MSTAHRFEPGNYRYVPGPFQYSGGVVAEAGFDVHRVRFQTPRPMAEAFHSIETHLERQGRPTTAFCACEMRSPAPFSEQEFGAFNRLYVETLTRWGLVHGQHNPVARSNVCPEIDPPDEPCIWAFCYTVPSERGDNARPDFVVAGSGEAPEGGGSYAEGIVCPGDTSERGLREKARFVLAEMERRMAVLGVDWTLATATQLYTVFDAYPLLADDIVARGAARNGLTWHYARPPVVGLDFEMDLRGVTVERTL